MTNNTCNTCNRPNIREDVQFHRGLRDGTFSYWKVISRRCADCGAQHIYTEEGWGIGHENTPAGESE